jgi:hypothetical protein
VCGNKWGEEAMGKDGQGRKQEMGDKYVWREKPSRLYLLNIHLKSSFVSLFYSY